MSTSNFGCPARCNGGGEPRGVLEGMEDGAGAYSWEKGVQMRFVCVQGLLPQSCIPSLAFASRLPPPLPRQLILAFLSLTV